MRIPLFLIAAICLASVAEGQQKKQPPNYTRIEEGLYLGGWTEKPPEGVTAVLNVSTEKDVYQTKHYLWKGIKDGKDGATIAFLKETVAFVDEQRNAGRPTFVHCRQGVSRGPLVVTAYLMYSKKWSRDKALAFIREQRPVIRPNDSFMELLLVWQRTLEKEQ